MASTLRLCGPHRPSRASRRGMEVGGPTPKNRTEGKKPPEIQTNQAPRPGSPPETPESSRSTRTSRHQPPPADPLNTVTSFVAYSSQEANTKAHSQGSDPWLVGAVCFTHGARCASTSRLATPVNETLRGGRTLLDGIEVCADFDWQAVMRHNHGVFPNCKSIGRKIRQLTPSGTRPSSC